jgi:hypothetical protein
MVPKNIICLLDVSKNYFGEVEAMIQCVEMPNELIFCILGIVKIVFKE